MLSPSFLVLANKICKVIADSTSEYMIQIKDIICRNLTPGNDVLHQGSRRTRRLSTLIKL